MKAMVFTLALAGAVAVVGCDGGDSADQTPESVAALEHGGTGESRADDSAAAALGQQIFFDQRLSQNGNQACAACHGPQVGWTGPDEDINKHGAVYEGSVAGRFGNRKPPSSAYATLAPLFDYDAVNDTFVGGNFWDGRATGWKLGNPAADQAQGPFLNPVEQGLPNADAVVHLVCTGRYGSMFRRVWGHGACANTDQAYDDVALSLAAYEGSSQVNRFSSKFDAYLGGHARLSPFEQFGYQLFTGKAKCANCHTNKPEKPGQSPLFTDFTYDNLGVPRNPENPFYLMDQVIVDGKPVNPQGAGFVDQGLGGFLGQLAADGSWRSLPYVPDAIKQLDSDTLTALAAANMGKEKVPTLRNVDKRPSPHFAKAYTHNGYFKSLAALVHFYNTRDVLPRCSHNVPERLALAARCWPAPEVPQNLNTVEVGNLHLSPAEEAALVAFLQTLSDTDAH